jgi:RNA polymerase sigma-70 factor (ECF subfamily)
MNVGDRETLQAGFRYALSLCHDRDRAKDLVHDAWVSIAAYPARSRALLLRAVRHRFIDHVRRPQVIDLSVRAPDVHAPSPAPIDRADLHLALGTLRPEEREVLYLSAVEGFTAEEIAAHAGQSRNTVLSLLRRGKEKLRRALGDDIEAAGDAAQDATP